jgi:hypothetical protein
MKPTGNSADKFFGGTAGDARGAAVDGTLKFIT